MTIEEEQAKCPHDDLNPDMTCACCGKDIGAELREKKD